MSHCHCTQSQKPLGILRTMVTAEARRWGLFQTCSWGCIRSPEATSSVPSHHSHALAPGWKGQGPLGSSGPPHCMYHSVPETVTKILAQTNLTQSVPALDYRTINPNYREVSMRDNWKRNATLLLPWNRHPWNPSAAKRHSSKTCLDEQIRLDGEQIRSICNEQHQFACQQ